MNISIAGMCLLLLEKNMRVHTLILSFLLIFCLQGLTQTKDPDKYDALKTIINNKEYRFVPQSATTSKGNTFPVDPGFQLRMMTDSISVDLPFYETGYETNFGANTDQVKFGTKQFSYTAETTKKGGWNITIVPKDDYKISRINLNIRADGFCTLQLKASSQQHISFYGAIGDNLSQ
jgi:hypothetical protein